jgi:hypothetical protein
MTAKFGWTDSAYRLHGRIATSRALLFATLWTLLVPARAPGAAGDVYMVAGRRDPTVDKDVIFRFDQAGNKTVFASTFSRFYGIAFDHDGNALVSTNNGASIEKYRPDGSHVTFASGLSRPLGVAFDASGQLYAADINANAIYRFDPNGNKTVVVTGLDGPTAVAIDKAGTLFCSQIGGGQVLRFNAAGESTVVTSGLGDPHALVFDHAGNLYVIEGSTNGIYRITPDGTRTLFASVGYRGLGLAFDFDGNLWATDNATGFYEVFDAAGKTLATVYDVQSPLHIAIEPATSTSLNISTRLKVKAGENVLIAGFIVTGNEAKRIIVRGIGPSLTKSGVSDVLADPVLELYDQKGALVALNDNWRESNATEISSTGVAPTDERESALIAVLAPGAYTAVERGKGAAEGIGLVEIYDLAASGSSALANISTRGFVDTGANVMIAGFIVGQGNGSRIAVRGLGPSLAAAGISNPLPDPKLELYNANGQLLRANDNWKDTQRQQIEVAGLPPSNDLESAIVATLAPGNYTAMLSGADGRTGVGLVEVYNIK